MMSLPHKGRKCWREERILTQKLNCFSLNANQNLVGNAMSVYLQPKETLRIAVPLINIYCYVTTSGHSLRVHTNKLKYLL